MRLWAIRCISICLFVQLLLTKTLWSTTHDFLPLAPFFDALPLDVLSPILPFIYGLILLSLLLITLFPKRYFLIDLFLVLAGLMVLQDLNRLQVWFYHLSTLLLLLRWSEQREAVGQMVQFVVIALYFWSGLHKLNSYFIEDTFPWFFEAAGPLAFLGSYKSLAIVTALLESAIGVALFFAKSRKVGIFLGIIFHLLVLLLLGPLGHNWNEVVWPWNICMMSLLYLLFAHSSANSTISINKMLRTQPILALPFLLFAIFPSLNAFGYYDEQLSFKMYSGTNPEAIFYIDERDDTCFPKAEFIIGGFDEQTTATTRFLLDELAFAQLKTAPYASERTFKSMAKKYCTCLQYPQSGGLEILMVNPWRKDEEVIKRFSCDEL